MKQYLTLAQRVVDDGKWVENKRTGKRCLTVINHDLEYNVGDKEFPLVTTRKSFWKAAVAELLGYIRGYDSAADFRKLGTSTWDANAAAEAWVNSYYRNIAANSVSLEGWSDDGASFNGIPTDYMGRVYGVQLRDWKIPSQFIPRDEFDKNQSIDQLRKVVDDLTAGIDDRGEILTMLNPGEFHLGCLRPCMYSHHFSLLDGTLYLNSTQRSCDIPLGLNFNMVQVYVFLALMAQITGTKPGMAYHKIVNAHIYEDQLPLMKDVQLHREPLAPASFHINPEIKTLEDLETWVTLDDFWVEDYEHHDPIKYPFSV